MPPKQSLLFPFMFEDRHDTTTVFLGCERGSKINKKIDMKTQFIKLSLFALIGLAFACSTDESDILAIPKLPDTGTGMGLPTPTYTSGSANFATYVAIGNSVTAGLADAGLYIKGQEVSFPNILATQFELAGGGAFSQPLMSDDLGVGRAKTCAAEALPGLMESGYRECRRRAPCSGRFFLVTSL